MYMEGVILQSYLFEYFAILVLSGIFLVCICRCCGKCGAKTVNYRRRPMMKVCLFGFLIFGSVVFIIGSILHIVGVQMFHVKAYHSVNLVIDAHAERIAEIQNVTATLAGTGVSTALLDLEPKTALDEQGARIVSMEASAK
jgi:hypothetical protein